MAHRTILIAASDPNIIYLLRRYAEASGFRVVNVVEGTNLVSQVKQIDPTLIILEIDLPQTVGKSILRNLKADPATCTIPVLVYSCLDEITGAALEGAAGCLQKAIMFSDFQAAILRAGVSTDTPSDLA